MTDTTGWFALIGKVRQLAREYNVVLYGLRDAATNFDEEGWSALKPEKNESRERLRVAMRAELVLATSLSSGSWTGHRPKAPIAHAA